MKEVLKLLHAGVIYPMQDSEWVSPVQVVPKKRAMAVVQNERNALIPQRTVTGWRMCIDYQMLNKATRKDHFPLPSLTKCLNGWPSIPISATSMAILVIIRSLSILMTRIRLPSPARMAHLHIGECPLVFATHPLLVSGV